MRHQLPDRGHHGSKRCGLRRSSDQRGSGTEQFLMLLCDRTQETRRSTGSHSESEIRLLLTGDPISFFFSFDDPLETLQITYLVIPAKAGIQGTQGFLDPGFPRADGFDDFLPARQLRFLSFSAGA